MAQSDAELLDIAIVGAGIAGLYAGYRLDQIGRHDYRIAEASGHVGGRIWSTRLLANGEAAPDGGRVERDGSNAFVYRARDGGVHPIEFVAEYGPMRIELDLQHLLEKLIRELNLSSELETFPPYQSPSSPHDPRYELAGEETEQSTPLELLHLAIVRVLGRLRCSAPHDPTGAPDPLSAKLNDLIAQLARATATRQTTWRQILLRWLRDLDEPDYQRIRQYGIFDDGTDHGIELWDLGFWNLLSEVLSHHAVLKLRDLGTFYHLIAENPNAAEWLIFWLRALRTSDKLRGIRGGMQRITETMEDRIDQVRPDRICRRHKLLQIAPSDGGRVRLTFEKSMTAADGSDTTTAIVWEARRVILAMPTSPLLELARTNANTVYKQLHRDLSAVFGFPLLKAFFTVKERWWSHSMAMTNRYATRVPTRELHYWNSTFIENSKKGLFMLYTDRPASAFWSNYINPGKGSLILDGSNPANRSTTHFESGVQERPQDGRPHDNLRLVGKCIQYLRETGVVRGRDDFEYYGIRDWGREPFMGAAHSWFPERRSSEFLKRLSAFAIGSYDRDKVDRPREDWNVHICGEAYSDYQAFIEGALRSTAHVLHTIDPDRFPTTPTPWLCTACRHEDGL